MDKAALDPSDSLEKPSTSKIEKRPGSASSSDSEQVETTKKCKKDIKMETNNEDSLKVKITLPDALKDWIIDDHDLVNRQKKIVQLPARITVDHILANYVRERVSTKALTKVWEDSVVDFSNRMRELFNVSLGKSLLYKFERPQYSQMLKDHKEIKMCQLYGAAHLTRLVCKIGDMLTSIREETQDRTPPGYFVNQVEDFLKFIASKESLYLSADDYMVATPEYHRQAMT
ncbi:mortality factor 4-like protein 1 [Caerostris extrusa]|uniref:Mortality factor 4-like protein 1 n=1 Tax=Caerostris extrusa TaxID=172846 RepID=A0AAV4U0A3_CAEEX|nr:mortality factor 4-like protein 1 [Caerostris extrusa]